MKAFLFLLLVVSTFVAARFFDGIWAGICLFFSFSASVWLGVYVGKTAKTRNLSLIIPIVYLVFLVVFVAWQKRAYNNEFKLQESGIAGSGPK